MSENHTLGTLDKLLATITIAPEVVAGWPSYSVLVIAATGLQPPTADPASEVLLAAAEQSTATFPPLAELPESKLPARVS